MDAAPVTVLALISCAGLLLSGRSVQAQEAGRDAEARPSDTTVVGDDPKVKVRFSGRVHRMIQLAADGRETDAFFTDSDQGLTMLRLDVTAEMSDRMTVGAALEIGLQANRPLFVSQDNPDVGFDVSGRAAEIYAAAAQLGKFSLGRGFMASYLTPEIDLSGTQNASLLSIGTLFGGLRFVDSTTNELTDNRVRTQHADLERLLIRDRLRYDSPRWVGLQGSASVAADNRWDVALRWGHNIGDFKLVSATTHQNQPFLDLEWRWEWGGSTRHEPTGLNATVVGFSQRPADDREAYGFIVKFGWLADIVPIGKTALSADVARNFNISIDDDKGKSFGIFALQNWNQLGIRVYVGVRHYAVDRPDINLEAITVVPFGALVQF